MKISKLVATIGLAGSLALMTSAVFANDHKGRGSGPVIYVTSQGLFYDTLVLKDPLPFNTTHNWQELEPGMGPSGLQTEWGPGDTGYYGGRWWVDVNMNGMMDDGTIDHYFLCPLLGPGREEP